MMNVTQIKV